MTKRVLCFGDSLTYGLCEGGRKQHPYSISLRSKLLESNACNTQDWEVEEDGLSGETTDHMFYRLVDKLADSQYDYVVILGGTNDVGKNLPVKKIVDNLRNMYDEVASKGARPIAITIPVAKFDTSYRSLVDNRNLVNSFIRDYCVQNSIKLLDVNTLIPYDTANKDLWDDALHFSSKGYDFIGKFLVEKDCFR